MSGTTLLASRGQQNQSTIGTNQVASNPSLIGQLPTNSTLLKAASGQNVSKSMFGGNGMPTMGLNNHRNTPPMPPTFQFQFNMQRTNNPSQRIGK
jgi:hypothetical protein